MKSNIYYKFCPINQYLIRNLVFSELYFASPKDLNDPFDCQINVADSLKRATDSCTDDDRRKYLKEMGKNKNLINFVDDKMRRAGVCAFSRCYKETLMWAHYAENHQGVCLGYESPEKYFNNYPKFIGMSMSRVTYKEDQILNWFHSPDKLNSELDAESFAAELAYQLLTTKSHSWIYEKETRIIKWISESVSIPKEFLKEITFGLSTSLKDEKFIRTISYKNYPDLDYYQMVNRKHDFHFEREPIW